MDQENKRAGMRNAAIVSMETGARLYYGRKNEVIAVRVKDIRAIIPRQNQNWALKTIQFHIVNADRESEDLGYCHEDWVHLTEEEAKISAREG